MSSTLLSFLSFTKSNAQVNIDTTLPSRQPHPRIFFAAFRAFLMPRVCLIPITSYMEMHHVTFSLCRHDFFVLRYVHSQRVYLQEESLPHLYRVKCV